MKFDDPWSDRRMTTDEIRDPASDWSFLWQKLQFGRWHFFRKSDWIFDTRTIHDRNTAIYLIEIMIVIFFTGSVLLTLY